MAATTVSIDELQRDADRVGEASAEGPVFITRPGRSTLAVIDIEAYRKLSGNEPTIVDLLANPEGYALSSTLLAWAQNRVALWIYRLAADGTVVTRNIADFEPIGVAVLNPWEWQS